MLLPCQLWHAGQYVLRKSEDFRLFHHHRTGQAWYRADLHAAVGANLKADVRGGLIFAFTNKKYTRLKVLYFDGTGLWLMTKRLEQGTSFWPRATESGQVELKLAPVAFAMKGGAVTAHRLSLHPMLPSARHHLTADACATPFMEWFRNTYICTKR